MKQEVQTDYSGRSTSILTILFDTEVADMMSSETLFRATLAEIQQRIISKIADLVEPKILDHIMTKVDVSMLVDEAVRSQIRSVLFPKPEVR